MVDNIYKKWRKDIEVSDDEDDTHPNVDTPSLFRWRHDSRVMREEEMKEAKEQLNQKKAQLKEMQRIYQETQQKADGKDIERLKDVIQKMEVEFNEDEQMMSKKERLTPWNVDSIGKDGFSKTSINKKPMKTQAEPKTEEERAEILSDFIISNESLLKSFGLLRKYEDSRKFLMEHTHLACENTNNYLVIWCINLVLEEKVELMYHVSHQCIAMQFLLEMAKQLEADPRACITPFFMKIAHMENSDYKETFESELNSFRERIKRRAGQKIHEAEEEARIERIKTSPGGLDPLEVLESLPRELRKCFESQDIPLLQQTLLSMPTKDANYHIDRCIKSGLWVPEGGKETREDDSKEKESQSQSQASKKEEISQSEKKQDSKEQEKSSTKQQNLVGFSKYLLFIGFILVGILAYLCTLLF